MGSIGGEPRWNCSNDCRPRWRWFLFRHSASCITFWFAKRDGRPTDARARIVAWSTGFATADTTRFALAAAVELAAAHRLGIWDSMIITVAAENGCQLPLSEHLQSGFIWSGLTVVNPFAVPRTPLLDSLLER